MEMTINKKEERYERMPTSKMLLWIALASITMLFAGLTSAYIVRQAEGNWLVFELPKMFWVSTIMIALSSFSMNWAIQAAKKDNTKAIVQALLITTLLGFGFVVTQYLAWGSLYAQGIYFSGNPAGSFLFVLTGFHIAHLLGGIIALVVSLYKSSRKAYGSNNMLGLQNCALYWHFLDGLWIYLFIFLLLEH